MGFLFVVAVVRETGFTLFARVAKRLGSDKKISKPEPPICRNSRSANGAPGPNEALRHDASIFPPSWSKCMNRTIPPLVAAALAVCLCAGPAAADVLSSYYDSQPAAWQSTDPLGQDRAASPAAPVPTAEEPGQIGNTYQDAFTETAPFDKPTSDDAWEKPIEGLECQTNDGYKGGKCAPADCWCPCWRFTFDTLVLRREHMDAVPLVVDGAGATLLDADDIGLSHRAGVRLSAARQINPCNDIEFEFFCLDQWSAFGTVADPGAQFTVYGATLGTSPITLGYGTDIYSFELNWRRAWGSGRVKSLIGFRIMELDENMTVFDAASPPPLFDGDIDNHLIGFQLGVEGILYKSCRWEIEGGTKFGVYHNSADFDAAFPQAGPAAVFTAAEDHTTFSGEVWLGANYYITNRLALRAGYQAMWIEGVAILPEQLDDLAVPLLGDLDMGGSPFYHGAYFGAQIDW
jgi:hypothetical protein